MVPCANMNDNSVAQVIVIEECCQIYIYQIVYIANQFNFLNNLENLYSGQSNLLE